MLKQVYSLLLSTPEGLHIVYPDFTNPNTIYMLKYLDRFEHMDALIKMQATGSPVQFASKLGIRRSRLFQTLQELRDRGVDIRYSCNRQSYYYGDGKRLIISENNASDDQSPV